MKSPRITPGALFYDACFGYEAYFFAAAAAAFPPLLMS
ncbi:MAG: hypothetical protein QG650_929 [Patescibacteria group bacterium]|nr:hypothetical protein [Patescibacteria group bacterium]